VSEHVLDSSAVLAWIFHESGFEAVDAVMPDSYVSTVNLAEVATKLTERGYANEEIVWLLRDLEAAILPLSTATAIETGLLRPATRTAGLSLGDRACLALAIELGLPALTADRRWKHVRTTAKVELIR
jgi:PIN domain nuclease of toxin-antitoxin system